MIDQLIPIHPKLVHFPIALFLTALLFESLSLMTRKKTLHQSAITLYVWSALLLPLVVRSGIWEVERLHLSHPVLERHELFASWTMWVALISLPVLWFTQKEFHKFFRVLFFLLLLSLAVLVTYTAHLGGEMVYEYGVGVEA